MNKARPRLRILLGAAIAMGPGKADLLTAIAETGSIRQAAQSLSMSYRRAWLLVETMNSSFREPLVATARGGNKGGGATITPLGTDVLTRYRAMEEKAARELAPEMAAFVKMMK